MPWECVATSCVVSGSIRPSRPYPTPLMAETGVWPGTQPVVKLRALVTALSNILCFGMQLGKWSMKVPVPERRAGKFVSAKHWNHILRSTDLALFCRSNYICGLDIKSTIFCTVIYIYEGWSKNADWNVVTVPHGNMWLTRQEAAEN